MKTYFMLAMVLLCFAQQSRAACQLTTAPLTHTNQLVLDEMFSASGQQSLDVSATFAGIKCSSASDVISYMALVNNQKIGPFSNGENLRITVSVPKTTENIGTTEPTVKTITYTVKLVHDSWDASGTGVPSVTIPGVMAANTGGNSSWLINAVLGFCKAANWSGCVDYITKTLKGDSYIENLTLTYHGKKTTCKPDDLTLTLPSVSLAELPASGKLAGKNKTENIRLHCDGLVSANKLTARGMAVYLYSSDLWAGSTTVLQGDVNNGVGFVLEQNNTLINIANVQGAQSNANNLWAIAKGKTLGNATVEIPITASYFVYDKNKLKPGALKSTALIYVNYD